MINNKLNILFVLDKTKINKKGICPVRCRITYYGKRKVFSSGLFIKPKQWNSKQQKAHPPNKDTNFINSQISLIRQKLNQAFLFLQVNYKEFDVSDIYKYYKGDNIDKEITILEAYDLHNKKMKNLIGIDFNKTSWSRYVENRRKIKMFINSVYKKHDIKLKTLDLKFIKDLEYYFKTELKLSQATINRSLQRVKKIILFTISENYLTRDPFILYKPTKHKVKLVYLTVDELSKLEEYVFAQKRLQQVKDMFIFCCYTGLAYTEMFSLRPEHIVKDISDNNWIQMYRQKTNQEFAVPLLDKAYQILIKYENSNPEKCLPVISNQKFNSYLKEISKVVGINKKLTHHIARKTFATTVLLYNDVPMEIVSELLGHSKITITQEHYARVVKKSLSDQMKKLNKKLKK